MKHQKPFDQEKYVRQLRMLGKESGKTGRNEPCPCGSGLKLKRCCVSVKDSIKASPFAGRLILGQGKYIFDADLPDIDGPLHPLYQLENRVHIAEYLEGQGDIEGSVEVLKENIALAEAYDKESWLSNALYDLQDLCLIHPSLSEEGLAEAKTVLQELVAKKEQIDSETYQAAVEVLRGMR
ncbi:MAG: YecA family protein [Thermincolia bacterium]